MPTFYSDDNKRAHFDAPQFNRMRHRYRGIRESQKLNLEMNQILFSIRRLYERYNDMTASMIARVSTLYEGGTITGVEDVDGNIELEGIDAIASRMLDLNKRIKSLEG